MRKNSGNALFMILIAIFLLGGVTALITRTSGTTEETGSSEKDRIAAAEIIRYGAAVKQAVDTLLLRGCSQTQIEFGDPETAITSSDKPADGSCSIFRVAGTGVEYKRDMRKYRVPSPWPWPAANISGIKFMDQAIEGVGVQPSPDTENLDSLFLLTALKKNICIEINNILGNTNPNGYPPRDVVGTALEGGGWAYPNPKTNALIINTEGKELKGKKAGCWVTNRQANATPMDGSDYFYFYTVLIAR